MSKKYPYGPPWSIAVNPSPSADAARGGSKVTPSMTKCDEAKDEFGIKRIKAEAAAREVVLVEAGDRLALTVNWLLEEKPSREDVARAGHRLLEWTELAAETSPAAAALLAELEELRAERQAMKDEAKHAALAPGEEKK